MTPLPFYALESAGAGQGVKDPGGVTNPLFSGLVRFPSHLREPSSLNVREDRFLFVVLHGIVLRDAVFFPGIPVQQRWVDMPLTPPE